jgi:hypothetical protein
MSLTSIIKSDPTLRAKFKSCFNRPKIDKSKQLLAEPQSRRYGTVGVAMDYLLRFKLEKLNSVSNLGKPWISELAIDLIPHHPEYQSIGQAIIELVKKLKKEYLKTGHFTRELIEATLSMAYLDPIYRAGAGMEYIGSEIFEEDIEDITKQLSLVEENLFTTTEACLLNPTFGKGSSLVGGADADFILGRTLIDLKSSKKLEFSLNDFCQIVGYKVLSKIGGIDESESNEIDTLGIYFSRYGYLFTFDVNELCSSSELRQAKGSFRNSCIDC